MKTPVNSENGALSPEMAATNTTSPASPSRGATERASSVAFSLEIFKDPRLDNTYKKLLISQKVSPYDVFELERVKVIPILNFDPHLHIHLDMHHMNWYFANQEEATKSWTKVCGACSAAVHFKGIPMRSALFPGHEFFAHLAFRRREGDKGLWVPGYASDNDIRALGRNVEHYFAVMLVSA